MILFEAPEHRRFGSASLFSSVVIGSCDMVSSTPETGYMFRLIHQTRREDQSSMPLFGSCRLRPSKELKKDLDKFYFPGGMFFSFMEEKNGDWSVGLYGGLIAGSVGFVLTGEEMAKILDAIRAVATGKTQEAQI